MGVGRGGQRDGQRQRWRDGEAETDTHRETQTESHRDKGEIETGKRGMGSGGPERHRERDPFMEREGVPCTPFINKHPPRTYCVLSPGASEHSVPCDLGDGEPEGGLTQPGVPGQCFWDGGEALEQPGGASILKVEPEWGQGSL